MTSLTPERHIPKADASPLELAALDENDPTNQVFTYDNGLRCKIIDLAVIAVEAGVPALTRDFVQNIAGAAWTMWNNHVADFTSIVGGQQVGDAFCRHVAGYNYINPDNLQNLFEICLNYAQTLGRAGAEFTVQLQGAAGEGPGAGGVD